MARDFEKYGITQNFDDGGAVFEYETVADTSAGKRQYLNMMYVSSVYVREGSRFVHGTFNKTVLDDVGHGAGFVLSENLSGAGRLEHAPDVADVIVSLGLVPDGIGEVIAMDRRGAELFAGKLLEECIARGAEVLWDGAEELDAVYGKDMFGRSGDVLNRQSPVRYLGEIDDVVADGYITALATAGAEQCRFEYELYMKGTSLRPRGRCESDIGLLKEASHVVTLGREMFGLSRIVEEYGAAVHAMEHRVDEMLTKRPDIAGVYDKALFMEHCAGLWSAASADLAADLAGRGAVTSRKLRNSAERVGIGHMIDALDRGVPFEDVAA